MEVEAEERMEGCLEKIKNEVASVFVQVAEVLKVKSFEEICTWTGGKKEEMEVKDKLEVLRRFVKIGGMFSEEIRWKFGGDVAMEVEEILRSQLLSEGRRELIENVILPVLVLLQDILEMVGDGGNAKLGEERLTSASFRVFHEMIKFLMRNCELGKTEFSRMLGISGVIWKFLDKNCTDDPDVSQVEQILSFQASQLLATENGQTLVKFWCENVFGSNIFTNLSLASAGQHEIYKVFTVYLKDSTFWSSHGKPFTGPVILTILSDLTNSKPETRKLAAATLRVITHQYSNKVQIFSVDVPETALISLNNLETREYTKFWEEFFHLHDILQETQVHIVQPVLKNLQIFHANSNNPAALVWLPVILKKMIGHDNRSIVKAGFEEFLKTGSFLETESNFFLSYHQICRDFMATTILPLIRDHIGWILNEPEDFFRNIDAFGKFLVNLYGTDALEICKIILEFLTSTGKCMGPHAIYFLVSALDQISPEFGPNQRLATLETVLDKLISLLSTNLTTLGKYFRSKLEERAASILLKLKAPLQANIELLVGKFVSLVGSLCWFSNTLNFVEKISEGLQIGAMLVRDGIFEPNRGKGDTYLLGLFETLSRVADYDDKAIFQAIEDFVERSVNEEILEGSLNGLRWYFAPRMDYNEISSDITNKLMLEFWSALPTADSVEQLMWCVRSLEVIEALTYVNAWPRNPSNYQLDSWTKRFLFRKSILMTGCHYEYPEILKQERPSGVDDKFAEEFMAVTGRNLYAEWRRVEFEIGSKVIGTWDIGRKLSTDDLANLLTFVYEEIDKSDHGGVVAGLALAKRLARKYEAEETVELLDKIADVAWKLVFELRKSEPFWEMMEAFVKLITSKYYVRNGCLNKFADLIFEQGETIMGLPLVLIKGLEWERFPVELLRKVGKVLVNAALFGNGLPKNTRVSFAIWEHLRESQYEDGNDFDPENFTSDCRARALACKILEKNVAELVKAGETEKATDFLRLIVTTVLDRDKEESKARRRYFQGSATHRIKHRILQLLLILQPHFNHEINELVFDAVLDSLSTDSPQPSVRYMGEWLLILISLQSSQLQEKVFDSLDKCIRNRLGYGAFFSTICIHLSKVLQTYEFYNRALENLATLTLSQHLTVRIYAQTAFQQIYTAAASSSDPNLHPIVSKYAAVYKSLSQASVYVSGNCSKLLENVSNDFYVNVFDCSAHHHPQVIFTWLPRLSGMIKDECILSAASVSKIFPESSPPLFNFEELYKSHEKTSWHLKSVVADGRELGEEIPGAPQQSTSDPISDNFQKKINPWKLLSADASQIDSYSGKSLKKQCVSEGSEGLVVVASLLDHLPNLGGLCRTCEIFGVQKYVVNSLKLVNDQHFQSLSVSAHNWVNILEVPVRDLESFLTTYSTKGYTILGIEQANESIPLPNFRFPKKSVLLLGNEKLGIPPQLLRLVDKCIEIPQVGIIRSLNVHVTGALCIYQYASQNIL